VSDALPAVPPLPPVLIGASSKAYLGLAELTRWVQVVTAGLGELGGGEGAAAQRPDGIFLGRGGLAPENFPATIEEVRAVTRPSARTSSAN